MDKQTKDYRATEISHIDNGDYFYLPSIKLQGSVAGKTNCLSVTEEEFKKICEVLTKS